MVMLLQHTGLITPACQMGQDRADKNLHQPMHIHAARRYSDYVRTPSGLQYQDLRPGDGPAPKPGSSVTVDWDGYTIGRAPCWAGRLTRWWRRRCAEGVVGLL